MPIRRYGDAFPITEWGQLAAMVLMLFSLIVLALPITIIGANFDEEYRASKKLEHERRKVMIPPHTHTETASG